LDAIMSGDIDEILDALATYYQSQLLSGQESLA